MHNPIKQQPHYSPYTKHPHHHNHNHNQHQHTKTNNKTTHSSNKSTYNRCWDWLLTGGNTHYARNRATFTTYRRAPCKIAHKRVLGIGTVELTVQRSPDDPRPHKLTLHDVLHMPSARCNGLSVDKYREEHPGEDLREVMMGSGGGQEMMQAVGGGEEEALWFADEYCGCLRVVVWGDPQGESFLRGPEDGRLYGVSVIAGEREMQVLRERVAVRGY
ncbi:hypothetical protein P168DRAFT_290413 [Aspergillus campestris IBT 28561]|uniref:Retrovirus-related Pol polyprotein from transposon TNT 1-94-like beta-barrel domain-containing protein n=1 Tax=Aspergillus campestris (strain IBT 28561) TaxID=1392248 RepID=A0A2I1D381_ASPC2|nr:uncharacterized protein P168DRAFT_290413 [Aspergillus campestris IBT 28561]PKY04329.1 hypothetical protein P168DRAFT_290413 [Aspergillus campestris IBT 28561]